MSLTWVVKKVKGGLTRLDKTDDGLTPMAYQSERFVEITVDFRPVTPCDIDCLDAFVVELQAAIDYLRGEV